MSNVPTCEECGSILNYDRNFDGYVCGNGDCDESYSAGQILLGGNNNG